MKLIKIFYRPCPSCAFRVGDRRHKESCHFWLGEYFIPPEWDWEKHTAIPSASVYAMEAA